MKYTEALRRAKSDTPANEATLPAGREAIEHYFSTGHLDPVGKFDPAEYTAIRGTHGIDPSATPPNSLNPFTVDGEPEKVVVLDETHDMRTTFSQPHEALEALIRQARTYSWNTEDFHPLWQYPSDFGESIGPDGPVIGYTVGDVVSRPVFLDPSVLDGGISGTSGDYLWAGCCGTQEQAHDAWEFLGSPGDEEKVCDLLMSLKPGEFFLFERSFDRTMVVRVDPTFFRRLED